MRLNIVQFLSLNQYGVSRQRKYPDDACFSCHNTSTAPVDWV